MANSSTNLDLISTSQASKEITANALFDAGSPSTIFGRRGSATSGLTWGFYGGRILVDGVLTSIGNGSVPLTASSTNYIEASRAGSVSKNTVGFTAGALPLYSVVTDASAVASYTDERVWANPLYITQSTSITVTTEDITLSSAQARVSYIKASGALTNNRNIIVPNNGQWIVFNGCTGSFTLTVKTATGSGIIIEQGTRVIVYADGADVVLVSASVAAYSLPTASSSTKGGVKVGSGLDISSDVLFVTETVNSQTGTTYTYLSTDRGRLVTHANSSAISATLPQAGALGFENGYTFEVLNTGVGTLTITPVISTIDNAASVSLATGEGIRIVSDGTNYFSIRGAGGYTLPTATDTTLGGIKVGSGLSITSGILSVTGSAPSTQSITDFANNAGTTTGLTYGYQAGVIRNNTTVTSVAAGTITLAASVTNYIEVDGSGTVSVNSSGFTAGRYPLATAVTDGSSITTLTDKRGLISVNSGTIGRHAIPVMAGSISPSVTGGCAALAKIASAANQPDIVTLDFDATTQEYAQFSVVMPKKWDEGTITFKAHWSHAATTTNFGVVWDLQAVAVSNDDPIAVAFGTAQTSTHTGGTTNDLYFSPESSAITVAGTPAAEDMVFFRISRVTGDANDTMAIDARLHGVTIYVTTDAETDA